MKKKILSGILSLAMVGSLFVLPMTASANDDWADYDTWEVTELNRINIPHDYHLGNTYGTGMGTHPCEQVKDGWACYIYDESKLMNGKVGINGTQNAEKSMALPKDYYNWTEYEPNTNYAVSITLRNMSEEDVIPTFWAGMLSHDGEQFIDAQYEKIEVSEKGEMGQTYKHTFTTGDATSTRLTGVYFGFGTGETVCDATTEKTVAGSIVGAKSDNLYIGKEQVKSIINETEENPEIGAGDSITAKAQVLNQIDDTGLLEQAMTFKVLNADRTAEVNDSGILITLGENGNYTISASKDATLGEYVILATSALSTPDKLLQKGLKIKVSAVKGVDVKIDDKKIGFDVHPIIQNNRTMVPMRKIFEELGCEVEWLADTKTIIATKDSKIISIKIGAEKIILKDVETGETVVKEIDTAPVILNNRTLVPLRAISESLENVVDWDEETRTVLIKTK